MEAAEKERHAKLAAEEARRREVAAERKRSAKVEREEAERLAKELERRMAEKEQARLAAAAAAKSAAGEGDDADADRRGQKKKGATIFGRNGSVFEDAEAARRWFGAPPMVRSGPGGGGAFWKVAQRWQAAAAAALQASRAGARDARPSP